MDHKTLAIIETIILLVIIGSLLVYTIIKGADVTPLSLITWK